MKIITLSLRRSGSTAFWKVFEGNKSYLALDEPCNPMLTRLPKQHHKGTLDSIVEIYNRDPAEFRRRFAPITKDQELTDTLSPASAAYFKFLVQGRSHWFMDLTRCHMKVARLAEEFPDAHVIHLFRNPVGFVSSHMIPSYGNLRATWNRFLNQRRFWTRRGGYNTWSIERIYDNWFQGVEGYFKKLRIPASATHCGAAHEKLLLYWVFHYRYLQMHGKLAFGERFHSVYFDSFCRAPASQLQGILGRQSNAESFNFSHLQAVNSGFDCNNPRWRQAMKKLGFSDYEVEQWTTVPAKSL